MIDQEKEPLISYVCITHNRLENLVKSIHSFCLQNYFNKELIVSYLPDDIQICNILTKLLTLKELPLRIIKSNPILSLGARRNEAIEYCNGQFICNWDEVDFNSTDRINVQLQEIKKSGGQWQACVLTRIVLYHSFVKASYISYKALWPCTLLCLKEYFYYPSDLHKDPFLYDNFTIQLQTENRLAQIEDNPSLYVFIYDRDKFIKYNDFLTLLNLSTTAPTEFTNSIMSLYDQKLGFL